MSYSHIRDKVYRGSENQPLIELVKNLTPGRALDCGCGTGANMEALASLGWRVSAVTISQTEAALISHITNDVHVYDLEAGVPPNLEGPFDLVVLSHVLEHLRNPKPLLSQLEGITTPQAYFAIALPNILFWRERMRFLIGRFEYENEGVLDDTHVRFYTFLSARKFLEESGFRILKALGYGWAPLPGIRQVIPRVAELVDQWALRLLPGLFGEQLVYLAQWKKAGAVEQLNAANPVSTQSRPETHKH